MEKKVLDLSDIQGYARLYATLVNDGAMEENRLAHTTYAWYLSNIAAYNDSYDARVCRSAKRGVSVLPGIYGDVLRKIRLLGARLYYELFTVRGLPQSNI